MRFDTHLHTLPFSQDSRQKLEELIPALKEQHLSGIITEHLDFDYPLDPSFTLFDPKEYFELYLPHRSPSLLLGVELGLCEPARSKNTAIISEYPWDYVLVSVHTLHGVDLFSDKSFYQSHSKQEVYHDYLKTMHDEIVAFENFDSLAHIDYICRYNHYSDPDLCYSDDPDLWDSLFRILIHREKALELNARRLHQRSSAESYFTLLTRFKELGGRYLTIGSDAHSPGGVGVNFDIAYDMAEKASLRPLYFESRKPQYVVL